MCGTYYVDEDLEDEIQEVLQGMNPSPTQQFQRQDIRPSMVVPVITAGTELGMQGMKWGFYNPSDKRLIINARVETAASKYTFREPLAHGRCLVPARGFYERDAVRNRFTFTLPDQKMMYMAGLYREEPQGKVFTILTTKANSSMEPVHDRMPLILSGEHVKSWLLEDAGITQILNSTSLELERHSDFEQLTFDFL